MMEQVKIFICLVIVKKPPYETGTDALLDGWRLFQASTLEQHKSGDEFRTGYLKYEFFFEKIEEK